MGDFNLDDVRLPDSDDEVDVQSKFDERFFKGKVKIGPIRIYFDLTFIYLVADIEIRKFQNCIADFSEQVRRCKHFSDGEREKECSKMRYGFVNIFMVASISNYYLLYCLRVVFKT